MYLAGVKCGDLGFCEKRNAISGSATMIRSSPTSCSPRRRPNSSASLGSGLGSFTISAWVKKSSNSTVDAIVWHGDDSDGSGASYRFLTLTTGQIQYLVGNWNTGKNI